MVTPTHLSLKCWLLFLCYSVNYHRFIVLKAFHHMLEKLTYRRLYKVGAAAVNVHPHHTVVCRGVRKSFFHLRSVDKERSVFQQKASRRNEEFVPF